MLEIFQYSFMQRAFVAGAIIGVVAPFIGTFLVARRYSLIADSLSHVALSGVALGLLLGIYPVFTSLFVCIVASIFIEKLRTSKRISGETSLSIFLSGGLSFALILIGLAHGFSVNLFSYLFGSIATVRDVDLFVIIPLGIATVFLLIIFYKELFYMSFDEEAAFVSGVPVRFLNIVLMVLTAIVVSLSMRVVGVLLIGALMVIPVVTATQIAKSFKQSLIFSFIFGLISSILGLFISYYFNLPAGGVVVFVSLFLLALTYIIGR